MNILRPIISNFTSLMAVTKSNVRVTIRWKYNAQKSINEKSDLFY